MDSSFGRRCACISGNTCRCCPDCACYVLLGLGKLVQAQTVCSLPATQHLQLQGTVFVPLESRLPFCEDHGLLNTSPVLPVAVSVSVGSWLGRRAPLKGAQRVTVGARHRPTDWASLLGPGRSAEPLGLHVLLQQQQSGQGLSFCANPEGACTLADRQCCEALQLVGVVQVHSMQAQWLSSLHAALAAARLRGGTWSRLKRIRQQQGASPE